MEKKLTLESLDDAILMRENFSKIMRQKTEENWQECWKMLTEAYERSKRNQNKPNKSAVCSMFLLADVLVGYIEGRWNVPKEAHAAIREVAEFLGLYERGNQDGS